MISLTRAPIGVPVVLLAVWLGSIAACDASTGETAFPVSPSAAASTAPVAPPVLTLKEQIAQLEKSGKVAVLDRSDSVLGPDTNKNGVRDDIDAYIGSLNLTPLQTKAALQDARAMQLTLAVDITDKTAVQRVGEI